MHALVFWEVFVLQVEIQVNLGYSQLGFLPLGRAHRVEIDSASGHNHTEFNSSPFTNFPFVIFSALAVMFNLSTNLMIAKPLGPLILVA